jgi:hypothetical protein
MSKKISSSIKQSKNKEEIEFSENIKLHKSLKTSSYNSSIKRIRKRLPTKNQRLFSSFVHAHGMDTFNDFVANTIARPKSILAGSILALSGVITITYLAKSYGYSYNYLLLFTLFILGYLLEIIIELIIRLILKFF